MFKTLFKLFDRTPRPVADMTWGLIGIDQTQFTDLVKDTEATVWEGDGGWRIEAPVLARPIFVPFNQHFEFDGERIIVQQSQQLEAILDRIDGVPEA